MKKLYVGKIKSIGEKPITILGNVNAKRVEMAETQ
jgi:hypothetical protein